MDISNNPLVWLFTGVYEHLETERRLEFWNELRSIKNVDALSWLIVEDFNKILTNSEKYGGRIRPEGQMENFRHVITDCGLRDLGFVGMPFTWSNGWE